MFSRNSLTLKCLMLITALRVLLLFVVYDGNHFLLLL